MGVSIKEYEKVLVSLEEALNYAKSRTSDTEFKIARDACIQRFEYCVELGWKVASKKMG